MGESEPFISQSSSQLHFRKFFRDSETWNWVHHQQLALSGHKESEEGNVPSLPQLAASSCEDQEPLG